MRDVGPWSVPVRPPDHQAAELRPSVLQTRFPWALAGVAAAVAAVFLWLVIAPLGRVTNDPDSQASVLYFQRIASGQRLEAFLPTTPKPLLTVIYGALWWLTHDWRSLTVITLAVAAVSVGLAARLATRLAGPTAAVLVVVGLLAWPDLQAQVAGANSVVWGLALWLLAGVLITADRPHPWLAGAALFLALLARTETVWLLLAAALAALYVTVQARRSGAWTRALWAWGPVLGILALPLVCFHDLLLTGNPLHWLSVPAGYTSLVFPGIHSAPLALVREEATHYFAVLPLVLLAMLGAAWLVVTGRRCIPFVLACLAGGVLSTLVYLAWRSVYVDPRYYAAADAPVLLAAAVGGAVLLNWLLGLGQSRSASGRAPALGEAAAAAAAPRGGSIRSQVDRAPDAGARNRARSGSGHRPRGGSTARCAGPAVPGGR